MFTIEIKDDEISAALDRLLLDLGDMTAVMQEIGELLMASTKDRFTKGEAPDGSKWAAKSPNTKGRDRRPLFGPSGMLSSQIFYEAGSNQVEVGSSRVYAAMMQFGGTKAAFPHLWGDIPARPFLGISEDDRAGILATVEEWLATSAQGGSTGGAPAN
ncbi:phage virion morphogenesis protein [Pseudorhodobacter sp. E13]|uniref:phage virion morphogenesis protein n=1 Tax=Pseudorhodobacter sp. E13 TaxID=2487931 RepID=UPI000F8D039B|nr:phage virion morphogenesis protein [Pseudorhodobacter sp. E13]RUS64879.1 phage virion morphogenesis protein [Pseudorhodobacter sp. E13]